MRPVDFELGWFVGPGVDLDAIRAASRRCAARGYGPVRIHHHPWSADCKGRRHELVATVEQMKLDGFELPAEVRRERR